MRSFIRVAVLLALGVMLAGCFLSREPLVTADDASFPFERIVFRVDDKSDGEQIMTREGDLYRMTDPKDLAHSILFRFKDIGDGAYVAQLWPPPEEQEKDKEDIFLYAVLVDGGATISAYAAMKPADFTTMPGLRVCDDGVCIDDLDAYAAYAKGRIAAGDKPEIVYHVIERE